MKVRDLLYGILTVRHWLVYPLYVAIFARFLRNGLGIPITLWGGWEIVRPDDKKKDDIETLQE